MKIVFKKDGKFVENELTNKQRYNLSEFENALNRKMKDLTFGHKGYIPVMDTAFLNMACRHYRV